MSLVYHRCWTLEVGEISNEVPGEAEVVRACDEKRGAHSGKEGDGNGSTREEEEIAAQGKMVG